MAVRVDGRIFEGCGRSKKLAKTQAAQCALQALFNIRTAPEGRTGLKASRKTCPHLPQNVLHVSAAVSWRCETFQLTYALSMFNPLAKH
ncbi:unnamed protein product [Pleuronectes platessa]|uniref:DRBM domain-containing protein n=1 Tax=Pleuronectes platessa TaxID=8262 RepID=A0A9N7VCP6_PLEPL|nr:unnamed protein product [Pleuronectes platessa]